MSAMVLLSGGLDSSAQIAFAKKEGKHIQFALHVNYGQKASEKEFLACQALCEHFDLELRLIEANWLKSISKGSSLTADEKEVPSLAQDQLDDLSITQKSAKAVWVPNRNGLLINMAAALAESENVDEILVGFNKEEATTFPDNSEAFIKAINHSLSFSTANKVKVSCYTVDMDKTQIIKELKSMEKFPFDEIWSCYEGGKSPCGWCESCQRFKRAMEAQS